MMMTSYRDFGSGERQTGSQLRWPLKAPRRSASAEYFIVRASELGAVIGLDLLDALGVAKEGVPGHVDRIAARGGLAPEAFRESPDVMRTCTAAHAKIVNAEGIGLFAEVEDLLARAHEGV